MLPRLPKSECPRSPTGRVTAPSCVPWRVRLQTQLHRLACSPEFQSLIEGIAGYRFATRICDFEFWGSDLFEPVEAERKPHRRQVFAEGRRKAVIAPTVCNLEAQLGHISSKENSSVIVETLDFPEIDRQMLGETEILKDL